MKYKFPGLLATFIFVFLAGAHSQINRLDYYDFSAGRASQDNGGFMTANRGATPWIDKVTGDGMKCFIDYSNPDIAFTATSFGTLSRTTNGGTTWTEIVHPNMDSTAFRAQYWQNPVNPNIIYGAYKRRIYKSADKGDNWFFTTSYPITNVEISAVAQSKVSPGNMILITRDIPASVYRSADEGFTWTDISSDLPKVPADDLFADPDSSGVLFLGNDFGVYRTANNGGNWARLGNGFPFACRLQDNAEGFSHHGKGS